jgi:glycerophosphoryl diester phosphodiesterase
MKVIEQNILSKNNMAEDCEDCLVITDHFAGVIDGATSKSERLVNGITIGKFASETIKESIYELRHDADFKTAIKFISNYLSLYYKNNNLFDIVKNNPWERPTASVALYSKYHRQVWLVGDCHCMIGNVYYSNNKVIDKIIAETRALYLELEILSGKSTDELLQQDTGREYILPLLKKQSLLQNMVGSSDYSYSVIDGFNINLRDIKRIEVNSESIILATDGYPKLFDNLYESEAYLNNVLKEDPLLFRLYKSTKGLQIGNVSFDDRTYLKIEL